ncbi:hypothetical protein ACFWHG_19260 [Streptomyces microflavus]|uniref:hypothetical protein n=1 Tax=Streptomyces microflavus TaxID=1919 RepID=UPI003650BEA6
MTTRTTILNEAAEAVDELSMEVEQAIKTREVGPLSALQDASDLLRRMAEGASDAIEEGKDTQPGESTPTLSIRAARTTVLVAVARALREQPTGAQLLSGIDELGEAVICEDLPEIAAWADALAALAGIDTALGTAAEEPLVMYRAEHETIPLGTYTTEAAARAHAEAAMSSEVGPEHTVTFDWVGDESDLESWWELVVQVDGGDEQPTGYVVVPITVASAYDPEAEG